MAIYREVAGLLGPIMRRGAASWVSGLDLLSFGHARNVRALIIRSTISAIRNLQNSIGNY